jgi:hypothetical protein
VVRRPTRCLHRNHLATQLKRGRGGLVAEFGAREKVAELIGLANGLVFGHGVSPLSPTPL